MSSPSNWYYDRSYVLEHVCLSAMSASLVMSCQHSADCACGYNSLTHALTHTHTHEEVEQQFGAANKCCLQFAHTTGLPSFVLQFCED